MTTTSPSFLSFKLTGFISFFTDCMGKLWRFLTCITTSELMLGNRSKVAPVCTPGLANLRLVPQLLSDVQSVCGSPPPANLPTLQGQKNHPFFDLHLKVVQGIQYSISVKKHYINQLLKMTFTNLKNIYFWYIIWLYE